jgi:Holliday junction resolvase-like predicted endonuclease
METKKHTPVERIAQISNKWLSSLTGISVWQCHFPVVCVNSTSRSITINFETTYVCSSASWCSDQGVNDFFPNSTVFH